MLTLSARRRDLPRSGVWRYILGGADHLRKARSGSARPAPTWQTDPALAYFTTAWELEYATCAKLVNYPDAPPAAGSRLRPEIAAAMPTISADRRTYTFQIRNDYAFSPPATGVVTAQSMKYTFERTMEPGPGLAGAQFFSNIDGEIEYHNGQRTRSRASSRRATR